MARISLVALATAASGRFVPPRIRRTFCSPTARSMSADRIATTPDLRRGRWRVKDGAIQFVGTASEAQGMQAAETIDLKGKLVLPGFVDAHAHAAEGGIAAGQCSAAEAGNLAAETATIHHPRHAWPPSRPSPASGSRSSRQASSASTSRSAIGTSCAATGR